jgi:hypothetical protein
MSSVPISGKRLDKMNFETPDWIPSYLVNLEPKRQKHQRFTIPVLEKVDVDVTKSGMSVPYNTAASYLIEDPYNKGLYHHVKVSMNGTWYYNQAIHYEGYGFKDFYENQELDPDYKHGYQAHINNAKRIVLEPGDTVMIEKNQAYRQAEIVAEWGREVLGYYEMPNGRMFLTVLNKYTREFVRNCSPRKIPGYWFGAAEKAGWNLSDLSVEVANS